MEENPTPAAAAPVLANTPGTRMLAGRYRVDGLIGRGGMAEVHMGVDTRLGRTVAIKLLKSSLANDPTFRIRFRQEAQAAARMAHPTIVRVFDAGEETVVESGGGEAQLPFIVMEFVDGRMLKDLIKDGPMTAAEAGHIVRGILTALEYSHRAGVVHRDIKPGNVMVTRTGQVKVMDFGIARAISDSSATVAQTTAILGTAQYFSPEQAKGETVDARSDLYSTGIVLFEMLTGQPPFRGDSPIAVAYQHVSEPPATPSSVNAKITEPMDAVILRSLSKSREERYQTAAEFREDTDAVVAGRPPVARMPTHDAQVELFGGAVATPEATIRQLGLTDVRRVGTSNRPPPAWIWIGIAVVIAVVLAVVIWVVGLSNGGFGSTTATVPMGLADATEASAQSAIAAVGLHTIVHPEASATKSEHIVIRAKPKSGTKVEQNSTVELWVSTGVAQVGVPKLTGLTTAAATAAIKAAGLLLGQITTRHDPSIPENVVLSSSPDADTAVSQGSTVDFVVSDGQVDLPNLIGEHVTDATSDLEDLGLKAKVTPTGGCGAASDPATVYQQDKAPGAVDQGSTITISYCNGT